MADPEPKATLTTAVEVVDEGDVMILSDDPGNSLTVDDLPVGVLKDANKQAATQIVKISKEKAPGMPTKMWNKQFRGRWWYNITYENRFILVGIYGLEKLGRSVIGAGIKQAIEQRYGGNIGTDLTWRNYPVDHGQHARYLLTQVATKVVEPQETITELQKAITELKKAVNELQKHVRQQQGPTGHNQGAAQTAEDNDERMEDWTGYCEEDEDEENLFVFE
ncbi:hypothetical protein FCIRC_9707 [Fusarium circinatum]|uniref:Uncharacterized protein n=1 Tax=Fusarium circinatum TaxID=48490 RepID=A0A8H5TE51_FUSCI|nr:hypothetical protein FCIRC_9707 [Fusarium circinatum]